MSAEIREDSIREECDPQHGLWQIGEDRGRWCRSCHATLSPRVLAHRCRDERWRKSGARSSHERVCHVEAAERSSMTQTPAALPPESQLGTKVRVPLGTPPQLVALPRVLTAHHLLTNSANPACLSGSRRNEQLSAGTEAGRYIAPCSLLTAGGRATGGGGGIRTRGAREGPPVFKASDLVQLTTLRSS